jgi:hypothetical protein
MTRGPFPLRVTVSNGAVYTGLGTPVEVNKAGIFTLKK